MLKGMRSGALWIVAVMLSLSVGIVSCSRKDASQPQTGVAPVAPAEKVELTTPTEFSADITMVSEVGTMKGKIFVSKEKSRVEFAEAVTVNRPDKGIVWMILPATRSYIEQPIDMEQAAIFSDKAKAGVTKTLVGEEEVSGRKTQKYRVTINGNGENFSMLQWIDKDTSFPVKSASEDGKWSYEYMNLKMGPQPPELFELPTGFNKMAMPQMGG